MTCLGRSIPAKIVLAILVIEIVLLAAVGIFYSSRFNREIDRRITDKLALPGILMNQRAMPYDSVKDFHALSDLVQEKVVDAFIFQRGGAVFFTADPAREGRSFSDFLEKEEKNGLDTSQTRQVHFKAASGGRFISIITPLFAGGELLGGLYVRISADAIEKEKQKVALFFFLGALLTIVLTTLIEAFVVHRLFVPRIIATSATLKTYAGGDFSARIETIGDPDQLGELMQQVNFLLESLEEYTRKLHALNVAGEVLARTGEREKVLRIAAETIERFLPVLALPDREGDVLFSLPVHRDGVIKESEIVHFAGIAGKSQLSPADASFIYALSGLLESALDRIEAFRKITEAEEKYRYLFVLALEGIFRSSPEGKILDANPALAAMRGYDSVEEMISSDLDIAETYEDPRERQKLLQVLRQDGQVKNYEVSLKRRDGSVFPAWMSARAIKDGQGKLLSIEGRIVDISERRLREQERQEQLAEEAVTRAKLLLVEDLEHKNKRLHEALDELKSTQMQLVQSEKMAVVGMTAGGVAHDLNNILAGVVSYPELLLMTMPADSEYRQPLEAILAAGRRAAAVVADLLTLAKGTARVKQSVHLHALVEEYLGSVEFLTMMRGHENVQVSSIVEDGETLINCSPVHIQKVIMNLVMNAVEAVSSTGGSVRVSTRCQRPESGTDDDGRDEAIILEVSDDGPGIPEENQDHIFEPFYTRKVMGKKGTGLGLTVVWNVVREHGGHIELESNAGGTTFRIFLPVERELAPARGQVDDEADLQGKGRILVVDDEPLQRDIAGKMLRAFGYEVEAVSSGEEAIAFLRQREVDLVLLDMLMPPGINGLQTYIEITAYRPGQKALIVSGFSESSDVKEAMRLGVGGFVKKPYTIRQIARAIKVELARQSPVNDLSN
jgi:PAS domain S-box-containing protein